MACSGCYTCNSCVACQKGNEPDCETTCQEAQTFCNDCQTFGEYQTFSWSYGSTPLAGTIMGPGYFDQSVWDNFIEQINNVRTMGETESTAEALTGSTTSAVAPFSAAEFNRISSEIGGHSAISGEVIYGSYFDDLLTAATSTSVSASACDDCNADCNAECLECENCVTGVTDACGGSEYSCDSCDSGECSGSCVKGDAGTGECVLCDSCDNSESACGLCDDCNQGNQGYDECVLCDSCDNSESTCSSCDDCNKGNQGYDECVLCDGCNNSEST